MGDDHALTKRGGAAAIAVLVALVAVAVGASTGSGSFRARIAYVARGPQSAAEVWVAGADGGAAHRLGAGTQPLLAPDEGLVAATTATSASGGSALTLFATSGSLRHRFFDAARATAVARAWSTDSRYLAVVLSSTDPGSDSASKLVVIDTRLYTSRVIAQGPIEGAGFAPDGSDRIVYASAASTALVAPVNIHIASADGSARAQITHDGRSLNPVWGVGGIAFDRERLRTSAAPAYQVFFMRADGSARRSLTNLPTAPPIDALVPIAFSADGQRLLAENQSQDNSQAWTITVATAHAVELRVAGHSVSGAAISRRGDAVLVDRGGFLNAPGQGIVESLSFTGDQARVLVAHGSQPSWNL